jgi:hypothetical protein
MKILPLLVSLLASAAFAQEKRVEVVAAGPVRPPAPPSEYHLFWKPTVDVTLSVEAALGSEMELSADLFQLSSSLAAPLKMDIPLGPPIPFKDRTRQTATLPLELPKIQRQTRVQARIKAKKGTEWEKVGQVNLVVYPVDSFSPEEIVGRTPLVLFGNDPRLAEFFKHYKVNFEEIGGSLPKDLDASKLYIGKAEATQFTRWQEAHPEWKGNLIVFSENASVLPGVFSEFGAQHRLSKVTLPILEHLGDDPRSQQTLLSLVQTITHQNP